MMKLMCFWVMNIEDMAPDDGVKRVKVFTELADADTDMRSSVEVNVPVKFDYSWTMNQVHEAALEATRAALQASASVLSSTSLDGLREESRVRQEQDRFVPAFDEAKFAAELAESMKSGGA